MRAALNGSLAPVVVALAICLVLLIAVVAYNVSGADSVEGRSYESGRQALSAITIAG